MSTTFDWLQPNRQTDFEYEALYSQVLEQPWEDTPRLLIADLLEERGQTERAEFIRLSVLLARPADPNCPNRARMVGRLRDMTKSRTYVGPNTGHFFPLNTIVPDASRNYPTFQELAPNIPAGGLRHCCVVSRGFVGGLWIDRDYWRMNCTHLTRKHPIEVLYFPQSPELPGDHRWDWPGDMSNYGVMVERGTAATDEWLKSSCEVAQTVRPGFWT